MKGKLTRLLDKLTMNSSTDRSFQPGYFIQSHITKFYSYPVQKYSKRLMIEIRTPSLSNDKHIDMDEPSVLNLHKCLFFHKEIWNHKWSISTSCYSYICRLSTDAVLPCNWHQPLRYVMMMKKSMSTLSYIVLNLFVKWLIFLYIISVNK
jgi:hypothetical protein